MSSMVRSIKRGMKRKEGTLPLKKKVAKGMGMSLADLNEKFFKLIGGRK